jgi:hypothetical protein
MALAAMKSFIVASLLLISAVAAFTGEVKIFAGARFDSKAWATLQRFDVRSLKDRALDANVRRLVELHFQFRSKELRHLKPNWYQASVWQAAPEGRRGFVSVPVVIAAPDLNSFLAFTTDHRATADLKIYGQVLYDFGMNYTFIRVIGTNTFVDSAGNTNVTW